jgi:hypothetical protein
LTEGEIRYGKLDMQKFSQLALPFWSASEVGVAGVHSRRGIHVTIKQVTQKDDKILGVYRGRVTKCSKNDRFMASPRGEWRRKPRYRTLFPFSSNLPYMEQMDHHRWNPPLDELELVAETVGRVLDSQGHERIRDVLDNLDSLEGAIDRLEAYGRFRCDRFDRRKINRRLKQYAQELNNGVGSRGEAAR